MPRTLPRRSSGKSGARMAAEKRRERKKIPDRLRAVNVLIAYQRIDRRLNGSVTQAWMYRRAALWAAIRPGSGIEDVSIMHIIYAPPMYNGRLTHERMTQNREGPGGIAFVSRANQAAAFDRISCSSLSWRFSRRSRPSSSRSAVVRPPSPRRRYAHTGPTSS
jgi:hypothetical protein